MTYPTAAPDNYDAGQVIDVKPVQIENYATSLDSTIKDINDHMKKISDTWKGLKLGWAGQTKDEVDEFNTQWLSATTEMFGDKSDVPDKDDKDPPAAPQGHAALHKIQRLVKAAAANYAYREESLCKGLLQWGGGLAGMSEDEVDKLVDKLPDELPDHVPTPPEDDTPPKDDGARDYDSQPITENNSAK